MLAAMRDRAGVNRGGSAPAANRRRDAEDVEVLENAKAVDVSRFVAGNRAHDEGLLTAVREEVADGVAHRAVDMKPAELALVIPEALTEPRLELHSGRRAADERGDRGRNTRDSHLSV